MPPRAARGFTLLELMIVLLIAGITLGLATLNLAPTMHKNLQNEAQRVALLLQLARDEAIVRNRLVAFEADGDGYRFLVRNESRWDLVEGDDLLRERPFKHGPLILTLDPAQDNAPNTARIVFGREPVDKPFVFTLASGADAVAIRADGIGHFDVQ